MKITKSGVTTLVLFLLVGTVGGVFTGKALFVYYYSAKLECVNSGGSWYKIGTDRECVTNEVAGE